MSIKLISCLAVSELNSTAASIPKKIELSTQRGQKDVTVRGDILRIVVNSRVAVVILVRLRQLIICSGKVLILVINSSMLVNTQKSFGISLEFL